MMKFLLFVLFLKTTVLCAMVRDLPFLFNASDIENATDMEDASATTALFSEVFEQLIHLEDETNGTMPETINWSGEDTPIFSVLRNFWAHAKTGLIDPLSDEAIPGNTEHAMKAIIMEATTMLVNRIEEATFATFPDKGLEAATESIELIKRQGEVNPPEKNANKRQTAFALMANMSSSCSNCYEKLQACVQKCFAENNCNDVQRSVRTCPPVPNRLCNFFTQWNPVDECVNHLDCKSPLLCCNDGCGNKCTSGVWHS